MSNWVLFILIGGTIALFAAVGIAFLTIMAEHMNNDYHHEKGGEG